MTWSVTSANAGPVQRPRRAYESPWLPAGHCRVSRVCGTVGWPRDLFCVRVSLVGAVNVFNRRLTSWSVGPRLTVTRCGRARGGPSLALWRHVSAVRRHPFGVQHRLDGPAGVAERAAMVCSAQSRLARWTAIRRLRARRGWRSGEVGRCQVPLQLGGECRERVSQAFQEPEHLGSARAAAPSSRSAPGAARGRGRSWRARPACESSRHEPPGPAKWRDRRAAAAAQPVRPATAPGPGSGLCALGGAAPGRAPPSWAGRYPSAWRQGRFKS